MKKIYLFLFLISFIGFSQTITIEAENGKLYRGASIQNCPSCSNLQQVGDFGGSSNESAYFTTTVEVATAGIYTMNISFSAGDTRDLFVSSNGSSPIQLQLNSGSWGTVATQQTQINLNVGKNTIKFYNYNSFAPNIDKYDLTLFQAFNPCAVCPGTFEAESGIINSPATIQSCETCSGNQQVGDMGFSNRFFTQDVVITTAGTYRVYISYSSGSTRNLSVTANETTTVSGAFNSTDWDVVFVKPLDIFLQVGTNTLKFHNPDDWAPNIDKFRLELLDNNANLDDLKVNGVTINGFSPSVDSYDFNVPFGTTNVPQITFVETTNSSANYVITQSSSIPGLATVLVTASDGSTLKTYTVNIGFNPIVVEAETGRLYRGATVQSCPNCSNLQQVGDFGGTGEGSAYFTSTVDVPLGGIYKMIISFSSGDTRSLFISPNGSDPVEVALNSGGWSTVATQEIQIQLIAGKNTIKFYNYNSFAPNVDRFSLSLMQLINPCNSCLGPFEAESGVLTGLASVQNCDTCSGNQFVGDLGFSDRFFTKDVTIPIAGTYRIYISFTSGSPRNLSITANGETTESDTFHSIDWDVVFIKYIDIYLNAGTNSLKFHNPDTWAPNIDKFSLELLATTWIGAANSSWLNLANWSNGLPNVGLDVTIGAATNQPVINSNVEIYSLTIDTNASVIVNPSFSLTVEDYIINNGNLNIASDANLIQIFDVANSGTGITTINRNSNALSRSDYTIWSSPVVGQNLFNFSTGTLASRFYTYNETNNKYSAIVTPQSTNFSTGAGYLIRMPNDAVESPSTQVFSGVFSGTLNNGNISKPIFYSGTEFGYNMVGNPYPSSISADSFLAANSSKIESSLYFWRKVNGASGSAYAVYNAMGSTATQSSAIPNGTIQVGQGFFVKAKPGATTIDFDNSMRSTSGTSPFFRTKVAQKDRLWLNLRNSSGVFCQTLVGYTDAASTAEDAFDAKYFNDSNVALTSIINEQEYTIQGRSKFNSTDIVALSFKTDLAGEYTIALDRFDGIFANGQEIYLVDNTTGIETNLKEGAYSFTTSNVVDTKRFYLKYQKTLKVDAPEFNDNTVKVYRKNAILHVNSANVLIDSIKVYDLQGRVLAEQKNVKSTEAVISNVSVSNQVLIVKIVGEDSSIVNKKVVN